MNREIELYLTKYSEEIKVLYCEIKSLIYENSNEKQIRQCIPEI